MDSNRQEDNSSAPAGPAGGGGDGPAVPRSLPPPVSSAFVYVDYAVGGVANRNRIVRLQDIEPDNRPDQFVTHQRATSELAEYVNTPRCNHRGEWVRSIAGFDGPTWTDNLHLDFDHQADASVAQQRLWSVLEILDQWGVPLDALRLSYSGNKGFHAEIPSELFGGFQPAVDLHKRLKMAAREIMGNILHDTSVYDKTRLWRITNTINGKTGLYKIPLTAQEVLTLDTDAIKALATAPRNVVYAPPDECCANDVLVNIWRSTAKTLEQQEAAKSAPRDVERAPEDEARDQATIEAIAENWPAAHDLSRHDAYILPLAGAMTARTDAEHAGELIAAGAARSGDRDFANGARDEEIYRACNDAAGRWEAGKAVRGLPTLKERWPELVSEIDRVWYVQPDAAEASGAESVDELYGQGFRPLEELMSRPRPDFIIDGYFAQGTNALVYGKPGGGKTFLAWDWSCCVAAGIPWHGHGVKRGSVAYLYPEDDGDLRERIDAWRVENGHSDALPIYGIVEALPLSDPKAQDWLAAQLSLLPNLRLFFIDTLSANLGDWEESAPTDMAKLSNLARKLAKRLGIAVVVIHHTGWDGKHLRGASSLLGNATTILRFMPEKDSSSHMMLSFDKQRIGPKLEPVGFRLKVVQLDGGRTSCVLERTPAKGSLSVGFDGERPSASALEVWDALRSFGRPGASAAEWMRRYEAETGKSERQFFNAKKSLMCHRAWVREVFDGETGEGVRGPKRYVATNPPARVADAA